MTMSKKLSYTFLADVKLLDQMIDPIVEALEEMQVDHKLIYKIRLCAEEILTNVCLYAYRPNDGDVHIEYEIDSSPKSVKISISDKGREFNPLNDADEPELNASVEDRKIGGLGLFIVKNTMDEISYKREDNRNILTMIKKFE